MIRRTLITALLLSLLASSPALAAPEGQLTWAVHVSLAPAWFDPAEKAVFVPIWELAFLNGHGPRVAESGLTLIAGHPYSAPYEELRLKGK